MSAADTRHLVRENLDRFLICLSYPIMQCDPGKVSHETAFGDDKGDRELCCNIRRTTNAAV